MEASIAVSPFSHSARQATWATSVLISSLSSPWLDLLAALRLALLPVGRTVSHPASTPTPNTHQITHSPSLGTLLVHTKFHTLSASHTHPLCLSPVASCVAVPLKQHRVNCLQHLHGELQCQLMDHSRTTCWHDHWALARLCIAAAAAIVLPITCGTASTCAGAVSAVAAAAWVCGAVLVWVWCVEVCLLQCSHHLSCKSIQPTEGPGAGCSSRPAHTAIEVATCGTKR